MRATRPQWGAPDLGVTVKRNRQLPNGAGRFTSKDGLSLWYRVAGRGPAMVVPTPGWGASADMYMRSLRPLQQRFTLIYLDTRGAGRSEAPKKPAGFHLDRFLDDLDTLRSHLRLAHWLVLAHSDATLQALGYAIKHPRACRGLFIIGGTMNVEDDELNIEADARADMLQHERWFAATQKEPRKGDDAFRQNFLTVQLPMFFASAQAAKKARHYFSASTYRVTDNAYDDFAPSFPARRLAKISARVAVLGGDSDFITTPLESVRLARHIRQAKLFMIRNAGHFPWLEQRQAFFRDFAAAARFVLKPRR
jgi:proline iminopeptidase